MFLEECEKLVSKGITGTGEGFDASGKRLGGFTRQPPLLSLRQTAVAAAAKRACVGALLPSGPRRLGGNSEIMTSLTPVQAAAMAAERRMQDDLWCGSGSHEILSAMESENDMVIWECGVCTLFNQPLALVCEACGTQKPKPAGAKFKTWSCKFCTLENDGKLEKCSACDQWRYSYGPPTSSRAPNYGT